MNPSGSPAEDPSSCWGGLQWEANESFGTVVRTPTPTFSNNNNNNEHHSREGLTNHHQQDWGWHMDTALQSERQQRQRNHHLWHHHHHQHPPPSSPPAPAMEEFLGQASAARREHQPINFIGPGSLFNSTSIVPTVVPPLFPHESNTMSNIFPSLRNRFVDASMDGASPSAAATAFHGALAHYHAYPAFVENRSQQLQSSPFDQHRRQLLGILGIPDHKGYIGKREAESLSASDHSAAARIGLDFAGRTYFSAEDSIFGQIAVKRHRGNGPGAHVPLCQADGCKADLSHAKHYHRRHKVCELHSKAPTVIAGGQTQRFCQQCSRFHSLLEFDDGKRSCRKRLADHNRRRRKPQPATAAVVAASVPRETTMPPVKKENDDSQSASSTPAGGNQAATTANIDPHGLLSAISLATGKVQIPVTLMTTAGGSSLPSLSERSKEAVWASQFTQDVGQSSTHLSLSSSGAGFELEGRPASDVDLTDSVARPLDLQHMVSRKNLHNSLGESELSSGVQAFPSLGQNLPPVQSSRDLTATDWMMIREQSSQFGMDMNGNLEKQQVLSLLEAPSSLRDIESEGTGQRAAVEFLQRHASLNSRDDPDSHRDDADQSDMKFSELHGLRAFGSSLYDSDRNVL